MWVPPLVRFFVALSAKSVARRLLSIPSSTRVVPYPAPSVISGKQHVDCGLLSPIECSNANFCIKCAIHATKVYIGDLQFPDQTVVITILSDK